jgi:L-alanine-DL-glutamate epimerase-like enolase superfamily enzyme
MTAEATDFIRTDPEYDGGITGAIKTARAAEGLGLDVEIHGPGPAHRHCMAAMRNSNYYENAVVHPEAPHVAPLEIYENYTEELEAVAEDGTFPVPDGPGLGIEYDWSYIEDHQVEG